MKSRSTKKLWFAGAALAMCAVLWGAPQAYAQQTSNLVPYDSITMEPNHRIPEGDGTAYAGIEQCDRLIDGDRNVEVFFETVEQLDFVVDDRTFGGVYHYRDDRGEALSSFRCVDQDGDMNPDCEFQLDTDHYELFHDGVEVTIPFTELTGLSDPAICDEGGLDKEYFIQLRLRNYSGGVTDQFTEWEYSDVRVVLDLIRPESPELFDAFATQNTIQVEFEASASDDVDNHHIIYSSEPFEEGALRDDIEPSTSRVISGTESGSISVDLQPGQTVYVGLMARDRAGNYSVVTAPIQATVVETRDFWDFYVEAGGAEEGGYGCTSGAGGTTTGLVGLALAALLAMGFVRRRRIRRWAMAAGCGVILVASTAVDAVAGNQIEETRGIFEFKLGSYQPNVDREFNGDGPYQTFFGDSSMLLWDTQLDYHLWQDVGKLSLGFHAGYGRVRSGTLDQDGQQLDLDESARLRLIPLRTSLVYRYDYSAHRHNIPLVPVLKAGLNYTLWRASDPGGDTSVIGDQRGAGGRPGWHASAGLHLHLDFFDRPGAAAFAMTWGIQNTYLFAEYMVTRNFGDGINLGDNHWSFGLAFEF